jgi:hypothetical protein
MSIALIVVGGVVNSCGFQHVAFIKQEHNIFKAYASASFPHDTITIASSLVFGEDFIHSYNFAIQEDETPYTYLMLRTYSRHDNTCYHYVRNVHVIENIVAETQDYLWVCCASG